MDRKIIEAMVKTENVRFFFLIASSSFINFLRSHAEPFISRQTIPAEFLDGCCASTMNSLGAIGAGAAVAGGMKRPQLTSAASFNSGLSGKQHCRTNIPTRLLDKECY